MKSMLVKGLVGILVLSMSVATNVSTAFAASNTSQNSTEIQEERMNAESFAKELIRENPGDPKTDPVLWNSSTIIDEEVPMFDYEGNVNSYLFRLQTNGVKQGFIMVDIAGSEQYAEAYCTTGKHPVDYMMLKNSGNEITARDKVIHDGTFKFAKKNGGRLVDLDSEKDIGQSENELQSTWEKKIQTINTTKFNVDSNYINSSLAAAYPTAYSLSTSTIYTTSYFGDANNCGPTACTNFVNYWKKYNSKLWSGSVYQDFKKYLDWNPGYGVYNDNFLPALRKFGNSRNASVKGDDIRYSGSVDWDFISTNIYHDIPIILCLTQYRTSQGHAVVCFGYTKNLSVPTLRLADGYNSSLVNYDYRNAIYIERALYARW
jgi:hypothetical protein